MPNRNSICPCMVPQYISPDPSILNSKMSPYSIRASHCFGVRRRGPVTVPPTLSAHTIYYLEVRTINAPCRARHRRPQTAVVPVVKHVPARPRAARSRVSPGRTSGQPRLAQDASTDRTQCSHLFMRQASRVLTAQSIKSSCTRRPWPMGHQWTDTRY